MKNIELYEKEIIINKLFDNDISLIDYFSDKVFNYFKNNPPEDTNQLIRFIINKTQQSYHCDLLCINRDLIIPHCADIFSFPFPLWFGQIKSRQNNKDFNIIFMVPTGIGCELGGHSGDANAVAKLFAKECDNFITHPNVVNSADINELPENGWYVEGSILTRFIMNQIGLIKPKSNKILLIIEKTDKNTKNAIINMVSAARVTLGLECDVIETKERINALSSYSETSKKCIGKINNFEHIYAILEEYKDNYDAFALSTSIKMEDKIEEAYFDDVNSINPWGGVEAMITHASSYIANKPTAHAPLIEISKIKERLDDINITDPRKASELISLTSLFCILKGLHKAPQITFEKNTGLNINDISCLIIPYGCLGLSILAAYERNIPIIAVKENKNLMKNNLESIFTKERSLYIVDNYLEALGVMKAIKHGISLDSLKRPIKPTKIM